MSKKKIVAIILFIFLCLFMFTYASPSNEIKPKDEPVVEDVDNKVEIEENKEDKKDDSNYVEKEKLSIKVEGILTSNNFGFDIKKNEYVNKQEFRYVFTLLFKSFMFFVSINVIISLLGFIDIVSFKDVISNFFCAPLFGGSMTLLGASFFSSNTRMKIIKRFYELDETKSLLETLEKNEQDYFNLRCFFFVRLW